MKRFPHDIQRNTMDCGATCLRIIGRYYGKVLPLEYLRQQSNTSRDGASMLGLSKAAEQVGFRTMAVKISFEQLQNDAPLPLIAHWNQNHFVVVYKVMKNKVFVSDPGNGLLTYTRAQFMQHWIGAVVAEQKAEGIALLLEPTPEFETIATPGEEKETINTRAFLFHYIKPYRKLLGQIMLSLVAGSVLQLFVPFLTQNIVDTGIYKKDISFIWLVLIAQLMLTLGQVALEAMRSWILLHVSSRINISLVADFFIKLMNLPIRYFDTKLTGDLMQRIGDHQRIESFLTSTSLNAIFSLFTLVLYGLVLVYYNVTLFTVFMIGSALYVGWILFFLKRREKLDYKRFQQASETNSKVMELISGMQEIKLHNAEQQKRWGWERIQVKLFRISLQSLSLEQVQSIGSRIINELKNIFTTVIAAKLVIDGQLTLGMMLSVSYIIGQLNSPILQLVAVVKSWQDARISLDRLTEIHVKEEETTIQSQKMPVPGNHSLNLKEVSFAYDSFAVPVLQKLNLQVPAGKVTAIVGSSGSGKTTLLKLLMRFYEPTEGEISVGGTKLSNTDLQEWRNLCGVVMQEGFIFSDTIAGNIAVGEDQPDWQRLNEAAEIANIKDFVTSLPLGFMTKIGAEGLGTSTGQKQRLLIARAVYKNPEIIFFDEATSALDANNEKTIMKHLETFYEGKTVVVVAHRLSTVKNADHIVVLEKGHIVEEGTHRSLTMDKGHYYHLVKNQLELGN
ncbi:peptidase domain-containing ABC transporter [Taibaiella soli]|uniref:Peptidase domain-containing ABC transporter n=1 Tax=Taibaiella soli TaxID=1649169 RepID=A0A2W2AEE1_9BACT|nr:peptidase domain-containing ABC transporter [Taibaiella soli]PZF73835.1 peptidase domain-containing ABC transporter [Taibaiella soli]